MKRRSRQTALRIERMEPRELLSGLTPAPSTERNEVAGRIVTDALDKATTHDISHVDARLGVLTAKAEARPQRALVKLQADPHARALDAQSHADIATSKAFPRASSLIFNEDQTFSFRVNGQTYVVSGPPNGSWETTFIAGGTLTVTPKLLNTANGFRTEVLDLNFQFGSPLVSMNGGTFNIGPIGLPTNIQVLQKVKWTRLYMYFTHGSDEAVKNIKGNQYFVKGVDPFDKNREVFFRNGGLPLIEYPGFFVLNNFGGAGLSFNADDFRVLNVPTTGQKAVNGMHVDIEVTTRLKG